MSDEKGTWVGIDAGGTSVRGCATRAGEIWQSQVMAEADGGPGAAVTLLRSLALDSLAVRSLVAGITKITRTDVRKQWEDALAGLFPRTVVQVVPDYVIAFHGAIASGVGVAAVAGTGSVVYGESAAGAALRVGGRGWEYGDEGSGAWLTTEIVRRTLRSLDGLEPQTSLTGAVCSYLHTDDPARLGEAARNQAQADGRGFLVPLLHEQALAGNPDAINLFVGAGGWLAVTSGVALRRLGFAPDAPATVATVGGLWEVGDLLREPFTRVLRRRFPHADVVAAKDTPVAGALRMAQRIGNPSLPAVH